MQADLTRVITVLRREYLFQGLDTAQLARIASFFEAVDFERGKIVFSQGDRADYFYIVLEGKVRVTRKVGRRIRLLNVLGSGDYFGELAMLFHFPRTATITTASPVILLRLSQEKFHQLLKEYPVIRMNLSATAQSRRLVNRLKFDWLGPEEVIYYITRKHIAFLLLNLVGPLVVLGGALLLAFFLIFPNLEGLSWIGLLLPIALIAIGLVWGAWGVVDWANDYYIVTSQRVVWQEKILFLYDSRREAPLDAVLAVNVSTSLIGRWLGYGYVDVRTFTGGILMRRMDQPNRFSSFVEGYKKRVIAISKEKERHDMEEMLNEALRKSIAPPEAMVTPASAPPPLVAKQPAKKKRKSGFQEWWRTFLKVRYQEGDVITYRKHWFLLAKTTIIPLLLFFGSLAVGFWAIRNGQWIGLLLLFLVWLGLVFWIGYSYVDWRNDIYRLTPEQIMDIEKKPLGREYKATSGLDAPDFRVEHTRQSLLNILLNFGDVIINIGQTKFTFDGVYNPDQVHQDVSDYREAFMRRKREADEKRERERMVDWLVAYYEQAERLENPENNSEA